MELITLVVVVVVVEITPTLMEVVDKAALE